MLSDVEKRPGPAMIKNASPGVLYLSLAGNHLFHIGLSVSPGRLTCPAKFLWNVLYTFCGINKTSTIPV